MIKRDSLTGQYLKGRFVLVSIEKQDSLNAHDLLKNFGRSLDSVTRKNLARRGPEDRQLSKLDLDEASSNSTIILSLHEAFFLLHASDSLIIQTESSEILDSKSCWDCFRENHNKSNYKLDFAIEYGVYYYFITRGWVVKSGENYGTNFLLYKEGPSIDHAQYAVIIVCEDDMHNNNLYKWNSLLTFHRVIQSVSKDLLLVYVTTCDNANLKFANPSCISRMSITLRLFNARSNTIEDTANEKPNSQVNSAITE